MKLLNSAVITEAGIYAAQKITKEQFITIIELYYKENDLESFIGYKQNLDLLKKWTGIEFEFNRQMMVLDKADELLVMKLKFRLDNPATKGKEVDEDDFEFLIIKFNRC
jgi:hypothetical protein